MRDNLAIINRVLQSLQPPSQDYQPQESLALIAELTGWGGVALLSPVDTKPALKVEVVAGPSSLAPGALIPVRAGLLAELAEARGVVCLDMSSKDELGGVKVTDGAGVLLVPLRRGDRVHLLFYIAGAKTDVCTAETRSLAESLAGVLSLALQNARLYATLQHEVNERQLIEDRFWAATHKIETLYRVSRALLSPQDLEVVLPALMNSIAGALRADRVVLLRRDPIDPGVCTVMVGSSSHSLEPILSSVVQMSGIVAALIDEGLPIFLSQAEARARLSEFATAFGVEMVDGPVAVAPLLAGEGACGALIALNAPDQRDFTQQDVDLLMAAAAQIVVALQKAQLFAAVTEERERLQSVVGSSRDGVLLLGMDLRVLVINKPALRLLGVLGTPDAWVDRPVWHVLHTVREHSPHTVKITLDEIRRVRSGHDLPHEGEVKIGLRIVHWLSLPVRGLSQPLGRLLVFRDVTEARLLEQFREDLTRTMVHDLRNPLTGIHAALNLLTRGAGDVLTPGQRQILNIAHLSTQRMLKLVNAILDISRLETGQMPLNPSVFRLSEIMDDLIVIEKPLIEERELDFVNAVAANVPPVWADRELVERVMQNLLGNALKFTPNGGRVLVDAEVESDIPDKLRISVTDSGPGIPPEIRRDLFTKFVTGPHIARGSGLGLAFCRMAVEAHGERIWVSSTSESGTTFTFTLPLASISVV